MKKIFLISSFSFLMLVSFSCREERSSRHFDDEEKTEKTENESAQQAPVMTEVNSSSSNHGMAEYTGNENYRKLMMIAAKCEDSNFTLNDLSQSDYAFMISFCNMMMDTAQEADMAGQSEEYIQEVAEFQELLEGFGNLLASAYNENLLDTANTHDFELLMHRVQHIVSQ